MTMKDTIDLRDKAAYEAPRIEDFGRLHDVTLDQTEGTPWRQLPEGLMSRAAVTK